MKKARAAPAEMALPPHHPYPVISEDDRAWFKLQHLKQDYEDLLKDAAVKRRRLTMARQRALKLNDEVRFLRRRYKFLIQNASPPSYKLKTRPQKTSNGVKHRERRSPIRVNAVGRHDGRHTAEAAMPKTSAILDLNQISLPEGEEAEFQAPSEAPPLESSTRYQPEGDAVPSGGSKSPPAESSSSSRRRPPDGDLPGGLLKSPICRDAGGGGGGSRRGKRKVSWQDQVALKV